jgi:hypothetical protein
MESIGSVFFQERQAQVLANTVCSGQQGVAAGAVKNKVTVDQGESIHENPPSTS